MKGLLCTNFDSMYVCSLLAVIEENALLNEKCTQVDRIRYNSGSIP